MKLPCLFICHNPTPQPTLLISTIMSELNDPKRIGSAPEAPRLEAHREPEALPAHHDEPCAAANQPPVDNDTKVIDARHGIMGAGSAVILLLVTIIVGGLLLLATHGAHSGFGKPSGTAFYMGPTKVSTPGTPVTPELNRSATIYASSPRAAAAATSAVDDIPVVVYLFNYDSNNVPENAQLTELAAELAESGRDVAIVAYTDPRGSVDYNKRLSQRRAEAIGNYLASHGVDRSHISATGAGPTDSYPTASLDRRAVITPQ